MGWREILKKDSFANIAKVSPVDPNKKANVYIDDPIQEKKYNKEEGLKNANLYQTSQNPQNKKQSLDLCSQYSQNPKPSKVFDCIDCKYRATFGNNDIRCAYDVLTTGKMKKPEKKIKCPILKKS